MEDFCYAGGLPAVMKEIAHACCTWTPSPPTASTRGREHRRRAELQPATSSRRWPSRSRTRPASPCCAATWRRAAPSSSPARRRRRCCCTRGRAVVFEDIEDFHAPHRRRSLDVDETCILVLKNCGPKGYPGMAEVGNMPLPPKVLRKGITDMVRISDARMSGTAYGTVVLHTAPEAAAGGPLALVQNGDMIELDVPGAPAAPARQRRGTGAPPRQLEGARAAAATRLLEALRRPRAAGRRRRRPRLPGRQARRFRAQGQPLMAARSRAG